MEAANTIFPDANPVAMVFLHAQIMVATPVHQG
jgi:hypothetical protein